jgi:ABC-type glycerol-3-phosphate transport system substrate-binding protein
MLTKQNVAKLADMGLARETGDLKAAMAEAGRAYGTPYYISPEQIRGEVNIDFRADVYSLGATFYHMVTGKLPFEGVTLRIFANSHDPMLNAVKWSVPVVKEKLGITLLMDEAAYGVQYEKAMSAFASGAGQYDLIVAAHQWTVGWTEAGYLEPLDKYIKADKEFKADIYGQKAYTINSTVNGKQVGLPFNMEGRLMFYRKDIFEAEGLKVPTTEKELLEAVKYFHSNLAKMRQKYGSDFYGATYMYGAEQGPAYPFSTYWGKFNWKKHKTDNGFWDENYRTSTRSSGRILQVLAGCCAAARVEIFNLPEAYNSFVDGKTAMTEVGPSLWYGMLLIRATRRSARKQAWPTSPMDALFRRLAMCMTTSKNKDAAGLPEACDFAEADFQFFMISGRVRMANLQQPGAFGEIRRVV